MVGLDVLDAGRLHAQGQVEEAQRHGAPVGRGATSAPRHRADALLDFGVRIEDDVTRPQSGASPHRRLPQARGRRRGGGPRLLGRGPMEQVDVALVGAGPVGAALAALLVPGGRSVRVLEARSQPSRDARTLALSQASREVLEDAGGWPETGVTPIVDIHVREGRPGPDPDTGASRGSSRSGTRFLWGARERARRRLAAVGAGSRGARPARRSSWGSGARESRSRAAGRGGRLLVLADGGANARRSRSRLARKGLRAGRDHGAVRTDRPHRGRAFERSRRGVRRVLRSAIASPSCGPRAGRSARLSRSTMPRSCRSCWALRRSRRAVRRGRPGLVDLKLWSINSTPPCGR